MRRNLLVVGLTGALLAGCTAGNPETNSNAAAPAKATKAGAKAVVLFGGRKSEIAGMADHGNLVAYDRTTAPITKGAATWHPVSLSEAHAMNAIASGELVVQAPDGRDLRLKFDHTVEHKDGNWSWIGRPEGAAPGTEAVLTFGEKAVFGSIPNGDKPALEVTSVNGKAFVIQTDPKLAALAPSPTHDDFVSIDAIPRGMEPTDPGAMIAAASDAARAKAKSRTASSRGTAAAQTEAAAPEASTVDVVIGYTNGFAERLGGTSQAVTRLTSMVDVANQALANSQVDAAIRIAGTLQVTYPDATTHRSTLFELTGVNCNNSTTNTTGSQLPDTGVTCTYVGPSAALQPLVAARNQLRADLMILVRKFSSPENGSCGLGWLLGKGQTAVDRNSANFGISIVGDSSGAAFPSNGATCRDETLAHEVGHNLGLQHDAETAAGGDQLDPGEFGRFPYSFGYRTTTGTGNFMDVMSVRNGTQAVVRMYSNPAINTCGGSFACGVVDQADNARALRQTIPVVATFRSNTRAALRARNDIDGDGKSEIVLWNQAIGYLATWRMDGATYSGGNNYFVGTDYSPATLGQSTLSGRSDVLFKHPADNMLVSFRSTATGLVPMNVGGYPTGWNVVGQGDINGDGKDDIFWREPNQGYFAYWYMDGAVYQGGQSYTPPPYYLIAAIDDFNGDGQMDIVWNDPGSRWMSMWVSVGSGFTVQSIGQHGTDWRLIGAADITGDGKADLLWRNTTNTFVSWWQMDGAVYQGAGAQGTPTDVELAALGDYNGDGVADLLWERASDRTLSMSLGQPGGAFIGGNVGARGADWALVR